MEQTMRIIDQIILIITEAIKEPYPIDTYRITTVFFTNLINAGVQGGTIT